MERLSPSKMYCLRCIFSAVNRVPRFTDFLQLSPGRVIVLLGGVRRQVERGKEICVKIKWRKVKVVRLNVGELLKWVRNVWRDLVCTPVHCL